MSAKTTKMSLLAWQEHPDENIYCMEQCEMCNLLRDWQQKETLHPIRYLLVDPVEKSEVVYLAIEGLSHNSGLLFQFLGDTVDPLPDTRSQTVIRKLKSNFGCYGIVDIVFSDNGSQFVHKNSGLSGLCGNLTIGHLHLHIPCDWKVGGQDGEENFDQVQEGRNRSIPSHSRPLKRTITGLGWKPWGGFNGLTDEDLTAY